MAISAGSFVFKTAFGLQCRVLWMPWVKTSRGICCSGRADSSSFPVRYIPKNSSKTQEPQNNSTPLKGCDDEVINKPMFVHINPEVNAMGETISTLNFAEEPPNNSTPVKGCDDRVINIGLKPNALRFEVSNGGKGSQSSFVLDKKSQKQGRGPVHNLTYDTYQEAEEEIDGGFVGNEYMEDPAQVVEELGIHRQKYSQNQDELQVGKTKQDAEKLAIELLATRAYTAVELRKKLVGKRFPLNIIGAVIMDFQNRGLINDCLYAETYSRSRWSSSSWGPRRIKQALFKKGVSEVDAEKAIKLVFQDNDSGGDQESRLGLSNVSMDHLFVQASKQWLRGRDATREARKSRIVRWLQYRGFNWGVINILLQKLEFEYPT